MILFTPKVQRGNWFFVLERRLMNNYGFLKLLLFFRVSIYTYTVISLFYNSNVAQWVEINFDGAFLFWFKYILLAWNFPFREKFRENKFFRNVASKLISTKCVAFRTFAVGNVCCNHFRVSNEPQGQLYVGWLRAWWERVMGYKVPFELDNTDNLRECVSTGAAGAQTCRSLGHHLLHPRILKSRALFFRTDYTRRSKVLMHVLNLG